MAISCNFNSFKKALIYLSIALILTSCNHKKNDDYQDSAKVIGEEIEEIILKNNFVKARNVLKTYIKNDPSSCKFNYLNAISYLREGLQTGEYKLIDMARVGFNIVKKSCPNNFWPYYYHGIISYKSGDYNVAAENFIKAFQISNYKQKDALIGMSLSVIRLSQNLSYDLIYALTIENNIQNLGDYFSEILRAYQDYQKSIKNNENKIIDNDPKQLSIEAILILNQTLSGTNRGVNLLEGLTLQFNQNRTFTPGAPSTISTGLNVPEVTYNMNIFNNVNERTEILARPSLTATDGKESTYFSGYDLVLGIVGDSASSGTIQRVPIGMQLQVTPTIHEDHVDMSVNISRAILQNEITPGIKFNNAVSTLKESISTTVSLKYGETAILSALTETSHKEFNSKMPLVGDTPGIGTLFNRKESSTVQSNVLILLSPQPYITSNVLYDNDYINRHKRALSWALNQIATPNSNIEDTISNVNNNSSKIFMQQESEFIKDSLSRDRISISMNQTINNFK